jgi:hypothetical protein
MNEKTTWRVAAVMGLMLGAALAEPYDFYDLSRYPEGGKLKPEVELYQVKEPGGAPQEYQRREVRWWPRKGVDIIEVAEGMPLRTWTWRAGLMDPALAKELAKPVIESWKSFASPRNNVADGFVRNIYG